MKLQIDQNWQNDSILFSFIQNKIVKKDLIEKFKGNYLNGLKNNDESLLNTSIEDFKENIGLFLDENNPYMSEIDCNFFIEFLDKIEDYYRNTIAGEFYYFRYYQYLTFFYSFIFLSLKDNESFKEDYLKYIKNYVLKSGVNFDVQTQIDNDFKRLGYWMATGSGKTLLMYAIVYLYFLFQSKLSRAKIKDLYIVVPSDELRKQHKDFLEKFNSNLFGRISDKGTIIEFENIKLFGDFEVDGKLTTINGISGHNLPPNSILLIDEAHKGAGVDKTKETGLESTKTKYMRGNNTFMFEFSATFQKAFEKDIDDTTNIFNTYIFSSIYKYNLFNFNKDGFGKNYHIEAIAKGEDKNILILRSLANYYNQLQEYKDKEELTKRTGSGWVKKGAYLENKGQRIYKPLYIGLSYKLDSDPNKEKDGLESEASLKDILKSMIHIFNNLKDYDKELFNLGVDKKKFYEIFTGRDYIDENSKVNFTIFYDKTNDEIRINIENNVMVINTGQNKKIATSLLEDNELGIYANNQLLVQEKLFSNIDKNENILFLFGSRKFVEGWDSKRPSTILLFKMGKTGTIISTQILGRGIRLYGNKGDGYRHIEAKYLENINIFGYDIDEFKSFIESLSDELYKIVIFKKKQYSKKFLNYVDKKVGLTSYDSENEKEIDRLFKEYFKVLKEDLNKQKEEIKDIKVLDVIQEDNKLRFLYNEEQISYIVNHHDFVTGINSTNLDGGKVSSSTTQNNANDYQIKDIFNDESLDLIIKNYFIDKTFRISDKTFHDFIIFVKFISVRTDKFNHGFENVFDISKQDYKNEFFIKTLYNILDKVKNNLTNTITTGLATNVDSLKLSNLIENIVLTCKLEQDRDKKIIDTFFGESSKMIMEKDFDDLTQEQKDLVISYFEQKNEDLHIYDRLFYVDSKGNSSLNNIHEINSTFKDYDISPSELKLNGNEEGKIVRLLNRINQNESLKQNYDTFYLRNVRGRQGLYLWYEDRSGNYAKIFPDFIFWFINIHNPKDITLVYYEPKGESIDVNDKQKKEKLESISVGDVDKNICQLFGRDTNFNTSTPSNLKIMGILEK